MSTREPFDRTALQNLLAMVNDDAVFVNEMIDAYIADAGCHLSGLQQALEAGNATLVHRSAHTLKSNSINFGALALADLCRLLEEQSGAGDLSEADSLLGQIALVYAQTRLSLDAARPGQRSCGE